MRIRYRVVTVLEAKVGVHFAFSCRAVAGIIVCILDAVLRSTLCEIAHGAVPLTAVLSLPFTATFAAKILAPLPGSIHVG